MRLHKGLAITPDRIFAMLGEVRAPLDKIHRSDPVVVPRRPLSFRLVDLVDSPEHAVSPPNYGTFAFLGHGTRRGPRKVVGSGAAGHHVRVSVAY